VGKALGGTSQNKEPSVVLPYRTKRNGTSNRPWGKEAQLWKGKKNGTAIGHEIDWGTESRVL